MIQTSIQFNVCRLKPIGIGGVARGSVVRVGGVTRIRGVICVRVVARVVEWPVLRV